MSREVAVQTSSSEQSSQPPVKSYASQTHTYQPRQADPPTMHSSPWHTRSSGRSSAVSAAEMLPPLPPSRAREFTRSVASSSFPTPPPGARVTPAEETYELDPTTPADLELIEKLRREQLRWRRWQTWHRERSLLARQQQLEQTEPLASVPRGRPGPLSDTEIYGPIGQHRAPPQYQSYRAPRNMSLEQMEARCAALKREFLNFRRQASGQPIQNRPPGFEAQTTSTSSSDEFESIC